MNSPQTVLPVRLRPLQLPQDVALALPWYNDPETLYFAEGPNVAAFDAQRIAKMYEWLSQKGQVYIIEVRAGHWQAVGDATLCQDLIPIVIGDPQFRNRGVGTQTLQLLIEKARQQGWTTLVAHKIYTYNTRSIRMFEKCGFVQTATGVDDNGETFVRFEKFLV